MDYYDTVPAWHKWADNGLDRLPRLAVVALVVVVWSVTLAWPPPPPNARPLVSGAGGVAAGQNYPLRLNLLEPTPVRLEELVELAQKNDQLSASDLGITHRGARGSNSISTGFAAAFASMLKSSEPSRASRSTSNTVAPELKPGEVLALEYDLAKLTPVEVPGSAPSGTQTRFNAQDGSLTISKPLLVDGQSRGSATIRIEEGAQILIATSSVADALGSRADTLPTRISNALATRSGFIPFNELRGAGIAVEYDPVKDRVSLSTPS